MHFFYAGAKGRPDSVIVVSRIALAEGHEMHSVPDLMNYVCRQMKVTPEQFDALVMAGTLNVRNVPVGRLEALETSMPSPAPGQPSTRTLTLPAGDFLVVVVLMNMDDMASSTDATWQYLLGSLRVESNAAVLHSALTYGGVALGLLILLVVVVRVASARRRPRLETAGMPLIRSVDGYPERFDPPADRVPSPAPDVLSSSPQPAAPASVPAPSPAPVAAAAAAPAPAPEPEAGPEIVGMPEVPRGGKLIPTLPPNGRWES